MLEKHTQSLKIALWMLFVVLLTIFACAVLLQKGTISKTTITETTVSDPIFVEKNSETVTLNDDGFVEFTSAEIEGIVTEIDEANSFLRIYNKQQKVNYTVIVSATKNFTEKEQAINFVDIAIGDTIHATANTAQDAFEFNADSIEIVESAADYEMKYLSNVNGVELSQPSNN